MRIVNNAAQATFPGSRAVLFGSQVHGYSCSTSILPHKTPQPTGLALPNSDLDIVVLTDDAHADADSSATTARLRRLLHRLQSAGHVPRAATQIIHARVPIIKCSLLVPAHGGVPAASLSADISLNVSNGSDAVHFVTRQLHVCLSCSRCIH